MATQRHGTPEGSPPFGAGDDRTAEEAALHIEPERSVRATGHRRHHPRRPRALGAADRPPPHYGFADEEPEFGDGAAPGDDLFVAVDELAFVEHYSFENPDDRSSEDDPEVGADER